MKNRGAISCYADMLHDFYIISCSKSSNSGVLKNAPSEISKPSHNFLMVTVPGFLLSPLRMLLTVACGTAARLLRPLGVILFSLHYCRIRYAIASLVFIENILRDDLSLI